MSNRPWHLNRRTFLRGTGVSLALPFLDCMEGKVNAATAPTSTARPKRICAIYFPYGASLPGEDHELAHWRWLPKGEGRDFQFNESLKSLESFRNDLTIFEGLSHPNGRKMGGHDTADIWLTGAQFKGGNFRNSISLDQMAAAHFGEETRYSSLTLSTDGGVGEPTRSSTLSFGRNGQPIPAHNRPRLVFDRLFGVNADSMKQQRQQLENSGSMLDLLLDHSKSVRKNLGNQDKAKFDEYLDSVRSIEERVDRSQRWLDIPKPEVDASALVLDSDDNSPHEYIRTMYDLIFLAFQTDTTRAATYQIGNMNGATSVAGKFSELLGFPKNLHGLAHGWNKKGGAEKLGKWDQYLAQQLTYFLDRLKTTPEGDGNLLDHTLVFYGSSNSNTHNNTKYPLLLAGGSKLGLKHGQFLKYSEKTPLSNLQFTMLNRLGVPTEKFIDSTGDLTEILPNNLEKFAMKDIPFNRREFGKRLAASAGAIAAGSGIAPGQEKVNPDNRPVPLRRGVKADPGKVFGTNERMHLRTSGTLKGDGWFREDARDVPIAGDFDAIVCGGGPAGFAAAIAAARSGASTALIEVHGCIGGIWTAGMLSWILDGMNKPGIMAELLSRLGEENNGRQVKGAWVYHPDPMKLLLENMLLDAGVKIRLFTRIVGAVPNEDNRLTALVTESKTGREVWTAKTFIDATGDGDVGAQAGCQFDFGRPGDGVTQPMSLMALFHGVKTDEIAPFVNHLAAARGLGRGKINFLAELRKAGIDPSYGGPSIFEIHDGLYAMMANHQYNVSAINADDVTRATLEARRENYALIGALRKMGGPWKDVEIVSTGEQIGTREARRIHGRYTVSDDDLKNGARFDDGICRVTFGIDVHSTNPDKTKAIESKPFKSQPYDIPLRALMAADVDGLMVAGRCISGGFLAHSSYRVTGNAVAMGEAAGVACAVAARENVLPHEVPFEALNAKVTA